MASDVKLDGQQVRVEAWDLVLDAGDRRKTPEGDRRALVHDVGDALTLNWGHDYPGGVRLNGVRLITKDPHFIAGITMVGGVHVRDGSLQMTEGHTIVLSDDTPGDGSPSGEIHQTDAGLQIAGGPSGPNQKPVALHMPVAKKALDWGSLPSETSRRVGSRARPGGTTRSSLTLAAGAALSASRTVTIPSGGSVTVEFDIVDTFIQLLDELSELRDRVAALEAAVNG